MSSDSPAISVKALSKKYRLGRGGSFGRLTETLSDLPHRLIGRGGVDPSEFWALQDVTFEVQAGEIVGVIGANGAGKSTLLKLLARITRPTEGRAELLGRVGSLLEVGTGFHPELTGRENIFLSGAILGMQRQEILSRFGEIVDFAGITSFLDTPVKRYSSGMQVRLGFAVAAHLNTEILLIDEVLSVGDMAFQKRSLGKMGDVAESGRTILFVSHNLLAVTRLCDRTIWLDRGRIRYFGASDETVSQYMSWTTAAKTSVVALPADISRPMRLRSVTVRNQGRDPTPFVESGEPISIEIEYDVNHVVYGAHTAVFIHTFDGVNILGTGDADTAPARLDRRRPGKYIGRVTIPSLLLGEGSYSLSVSLGVPYSTPFDRHQDIISIEVVDRLSERRAWQHQRRPGILGLELPWEVTITEEWRQDE